MTTDDLNGLRAYVETVVLNLSQRMDATFEHDRQARHAELVRFRDTIDTALAEWVIKTNNEAILREVRFRQELTQRMILYATIGPLSSLFGFALWVWLRSRGYF